MLGTWRMANWISAFYDQVGRLVLAKTSEVDNNEMTTIVDIQSLPAGLYMVSLTDSNGKNMIMKFVKN
jgi:hypothetical protein